MNALARTTRVNRFIHRRLASVLFIACLFTTANAAYDFDTDQTYLAEASDLKGWWETTQRITQQEFHFERCLADEDECSGYLAGWRRLIVRGQALDDEQKLRLVNRYINRFQRYRTDRRQEVSVAEEQTVQVRQQWSTLYEFYQRGGDCEDFATSKYQVLKSLGFPPEHLRILVVYDRHERQYHAVLAVQSLNGDSYLLDIDNRIYRSKPIHYEYIYAVNEDSVWDHGLEGVRVPRSLRRVLAH